MNLAKRRPGWLQGRRLLILILLLALVLPGAIQPESRAWAGAQAVVEVSDAVGSPGGTVEMAVSLSDTAHLPGVTGISGGELELIFDAGILEVAHASHVTWGSIIPDPGDWYLEVNPQYTPNSIKVAWASGTESHLDGTIIHVVFQVAGEGTGEVTVGELVLKDQDVAEIPPGSIAVLKGTVTTKTVRRISGPNRFTTAVNISQEGWPDGAGTVILARGDDFADALAGVPLAYHLDAPILLTRTDRTVAQTMEEIEHLGAQQVILLGGTGAISQAVEDALDALGLTVERIAGPNRYATAVLIAEKLKDEGADFDTAFIAVGTNFADALAASAYAAMQGRPILLTRADRLHAATDEALEDLEITSTVVCGGLGAVSEAVFGLLPNPQRIAGPNRYATAVALAEAFLAPELTHVSMATGLDFPDAIAGGVLAAKMNTGVLLVRGDRSEPNLVVKDFLDGRQITAVTLFGGAGAISGEMEVWFGSN